MRSSLILAAAASVSAAMLPSGPLTFADVTPATQPDNLAAAPRAAPVPVMIFPFRLLGGTNQGAWIAGAIQEDLSSELAKNPAVMLLTAPLTATAGPSDAVQAGIRAGAKYVVDGSYQLVDGQVRVTGSILSVPDGGTLAPLSSTGNLRTLFQMEDGLSAQLERVLPIPPAVVIQSNTPQGPQTSYYYSQPQSDYYASPAPSPDYSAVAPEYDYYYPVPYGYPLYSDGWVYGGLGFYGGNFFGGFGHHFDHHRGFDGIHHFGGFGSGFHGHVGGFHAGGDFHGGGGFHGGGRR